MGGDFHILSNKYTDSFKPSKGNWRIVNQSFQVDFEGSWGEVTFNSYAPEKHLDTLQDVSFTLSKGEEELFAFPDVIEGNYRSEEHFDEVLAVSFRDYDGDEQRDVTIICRYAYSSGDKAGDTFNEVRLYRNQGDTFVLDKGRMEWLNENGLNRNIDEVLKHAEDALLHEK